MQKFHLLVEASGILKTATVSAQSIEEACEKAEAKGLIVVSSDQRHPPTGLLAFCTVLCLVTAVLSLVSPVLVFVVAHVPFDAAVGSYFVVGATCSSVVFLTLAALCQAAKFLVSR